MEQKQRWKQEDWPEVLPAVPQATAEGVISEPQRRGTPWWSSGEDAMLSVLRARVGEGKSHKPRVMAKKTKHKEPQELEAVGRTERDSGFRGLWGVTRQGRQKG